jgi:pimeloyl-ACP methyl ester carboxylesterase
MPRLITEYLNVPGAKLAYSQNGNGPVMLLLHGNSGSKKDFLSYQLDFFPDFHTIAVDSRCHGETVSEDLWLSFDQFSDDLLAFFTSLNITSAVIIGYSDGGNLSLFLAKKAPQIFKKIVAISPNYLAEGVNDNFQRGIEKTTRILSWLSKLRLPTKRMLMRMELMTNDIGLTDNDLSSISTSVTIIHAEHDLIKPSHINQMTSLIPGCQVKLIPDCNHLTILNKPATVGTIREVLP